MPPSGSLPSKRAGAGFRVSYGRFVSICRSASEPPSCPDSRLKPAYSVRSSSPRTVGPSTRMSRTRLPRLGRLPLPEGGASSRMLVRSARRPVCDRPSQVPPASRSRPQSTSASRPVDDWRVRQRGPSVWRERYSSRLAARMLRLVSVQSVKHAQSGVQRVGGVIERPECDAHDQCSNGAGHRLRRGGHSRTPRTVRPRV
jgi:hypothetical protein